MVKEEVAPVTGAGRLSLLGDTQCPSPNAQLPLAASGHRKRPSLFTLQLFQLEEVSSSESDAILMLKEACSKVR